MSICPHCGKAIGNDVDVMPTFVNLNNNNGCNPTTLNITFSPAANCTQPAQALTCWNVNASACNPYPQVTYIKF